MAKFVFDLPTFILNVSEDASNPDYNMHLIFCVREPKVYDFRVDILDKLNDFQTVLQKFWKEDGLEYKEIVVTTSSKSKPDGDGNRIPSPNPQSSSRNWRSSTTYQTTGNMAFCNFCKKEYAHPKNNCPKYGKY